MENISEGRARGLTQVVLCAITSLAPLVTLVAQDHQYLDQGWSEQDREWFYYTTQGSRLIPYDWFLGLEQPDNTALFSNSSHLSSFGFLYDRDSTLNPDRLPIGFAKDESAVDEAYKLKIAQLEFGLTTAEYRANRELASENADESVFSWSSVNLPSRKNANRGSFPNEKTWIGWTCAACHTGQVESDNYSFLIDGAPAVVDIMRFMDRLIAAIDATTRDDAKFTRFANRILGANASSEDRAQLLESLSNFNTALAGWTARNRPISPYGAARLDAFGILINEIIGTAMELPENWRKPNAPVSFPFLWNTPDLDWVQWNGSVHSPLARNVGEVLGVFADLRMVDLQSVETSAKIRNLVALEERVKKLKPPIWPKHLKAINVDAARKGEDHYRKYDCAECHSLPPYPTVAAPAPFRELVEIRMIPLSVIGTDPAAAVSFLSRSGKSGVLKPLLNNRDDVPVPELLTTAVGAAIRSEFQRLAIPPEEQLVMNDRRRSKMPTPEHLAGYKARPLSGIWATAPYLHNGSVPTLFDMLLPQERRPKKFRVGSRRFDVKNVGFSGDEGDFEFDTNLPGNANSGHEYAKSMTDDERYELVEFLKSL